MSFVETGSDLTWRRSFVVVDFEFATAEFERATSFEKCSALGDGDDIKLKTIVKIVAREIAVS